MLKIKELFIKNFRCIKEISLNFNKKINIIYGKNGSGKTSIIEAIYFLITGKMLKHFNIDKLTRDNKESFFIKCSFFYKNSIIKIMCEKIKKHNKKIKINGIISKSQITIIRKIPIIISNVESTDIIDIPEKRKNIINWIGFFFKPEFIILNKNLNIVINQRNFALRNNFSEKIINILNNSISDISKNFNALKIIIFNLFKKEFYKLLKLFFDINIKIIFYPGWNTSKCLKNILNINFQIDRFSKNTKYGSHKSNIGLFIENINVSSILSRGQKRLLSIIIQIAQINVLKNNKNINTLLFIDDIYSDIDNSKILNLIKYIEKSNIQLNITLLNKDFIYNIKKIYKHLNYFSI